MKTYDAATFRRAKAEWAEGRFGSEWDEARRISWERGFPLPPTGSSVDSAEEDEAPSQRSIIWRALDFRPEGTIAIIARSRSWSQVVAQIMGEELQLQRSIDADERAADEERRSYPSRSEAAGVLDRLGWQR